MYLLSILLSKFKYHFYVINIEVCCASSRVRTCDGLFPQSGLKPDALDHSAMDAQQKIKIKLYKTFLIHIHKTFVSIH